MFVLNQLSFKIKYQLEFDEGHVDEETYATNLFTVSVLGIILGLISMRRVTGSLKAVLALWLQFPPLLLLPMFGFITFGPTPKGETLYWNLSEGGRYCERISYCQEGPSFSAIIK